MIDRDQLVDRAIAVGDPERIVDEVLLPALTEYLEGDERTRVATAVDIAGRTYQAAIRRQREMIDRLSEDR